MRPALLLAAASLALLGCPPSQPRSAPHHAAAPAVEPHPALAPPDAPTRHLVAAEP